MTGAMAETALVRAVGDVVAASATGPRAAIDALARAARDVGGAVAASATWSAEPPNATLVGATTTGARRLEAALRRSPSSPLNRSLHHRVPVEVRDLAEDRDAGCRAVARAVGLRSLVAAPLLALGSASGVIGVYTSSPRRWTGAVVADLQSLARATAAAIATAVTLDSARQTNAQLEMALRSRVVIEQAKGIVAASLRTDVDAAFAILRDHARRTNATLRSVAEAVVELRLLPTSTADPSDIRRGGRAGLRSVAGASDRAG